MFKNKKTFENNDNFYKKYLKYKAKYLSIGGSDVVSHVDDNVELKHIIMMYSKEGNFKIVQIEQNEFYLFLNSQKVLKNQLIKELEEVPTGTSTSEEIQSILLSFSKIKSNLNESQTDYIFNLTRHSIHKPYMFNFEIKKKTDSKLIFNSQFSRTEFLKEFFELFSKDDIEKVSLGIEKDQPKMKAVKFLIEECENIINQERFDSFNSKYTGYDIKSNYNFNVYYFAMFLEYCWTDLDRFLNALSDTTPTSSDMSITVIGVNYTFKLQKCDKNYVLTINLINIDLSNFLICYITFNNIKDIKKFFQDIIKKHPIIISGVLRQDYQTIEQTIEQE